MALSLHEDTHMARFLVIREDMSPCSQVGGEARMHVSEHAFEGRVSAIAYIGASMDRVATSEYGLDGPVDDDGWVVTEYPSVYAHTREYRHLDLEHDRWFLISLPV